MGLRARKCKPSLGKVTKKPGLLKGTGEKTMSPSSKFLAITICTNHRHSSHCRRLSIWGSIPNPCRPLSAAWVAHGTCAFLLCNVPTVQPFPYGLRLTEESWQHLGSPRSSCQNALVHAHVATQRPNWPQPRYEDDFWELLVCIGFLTGT